MAYFSSMPELIYSRLCHDFTQNGYSLAVEIYRLEGRRNWQLEVVNEQGTSITWNKQFDTEHEADDAFSEKMERDGIGAFLDNDDDAVAQSPGARLH